MAFFRKIQASLVKSDIEEYVGELGQLFFNIETGELRLGDDVTPGGLPIFGMGSSSVLVNVIGAVDRESDLELDYSGDVGDSVFVDETKDFYVWNGSKWINVGPIKGDIGFTGSQGDIGYTGSRGMGFTGSQGYTGSQGERGTRGFTGSVGFVGSIGFTGSQGERGYAGSRGFTGFVGSQGDTGLAGNQGEFGYTGSQGEFGYTGSRGFTGFVGSQGIIGFTGSRGFTGSQGFAGSQGELGYTGSQGARGGRGYVGSQGSDGVTGFTGSQGDTGFTGSQGDTGFVGSQGELGYTGSQGPQGLPGEASAIGYTGSAGSSNLIFTEDSTFAQLTNYKSDSGEIFTVRTAQISNGTFILNLASFTPILSATVLPNTLLNWDVTVTAFSVNVTNPTDFTSRYISSVRSITQLTGSVSENLEDFSTSGPNIIPIGGSTWQQTFNTNNIISFIRSNSTTISGGSASANVKFNETSATGEENEFVGGSVNWTVNWNTPTLSASISNLNGNTFLQTYSSTSYTITVTSISNSQNFQHTVTGNNGSVSNSSGNGTLTFIDPIHKNNTNIIRSISVSTLFTRPQSVTGTSYTVTLTSNSSNVSAGFTYPTFWIFTSSISEPPNRELIVDNSSFRTGVTVLGNSIKTFSSSVNNNSTSPRVFWFGVRSAASQPTIFRTGASSSLLSDVSPTISSVELAPDIIPTGYLNEQYSLYGIVLQPGSTFISIS
jgi:hypothetical protein